MVRASKKNNDTVALKFENNEKLVIKKREGNFYFITKSSDDEEITFEIPLHDYDLYKSCEGFYTKMVDYKPFGMGIDEEFKQADSESEFPLVRDGIVTMYSDSEFLEEKADSFELKKAKNKYLLTMKRGHHNYSDKIVVKIASAFSRYSFFYQPVADLFDEVEEMEFDYPQISIEEYLAKRKVKKRR